MFLIGREIFEIALIERFPAKKIRQRRTGGGQAHPKNGFEMSDFLFCRNSIFIAVTTESRITGKAFNKEIILSFTSFF
jgi:hypothetical protein